MAKTFALLAVLMTVLLSGTVQAQQRHQYTYCWASAGDGNYVFSAPFPALPEIVAGQSEDQVSEANRIKYRQGNREFETYLESKGYTSSSDEDCYQIGAFLPDDASTEAKAIEFARNKMASMSRDNQRPNPIYVDFVPSWAKGNGAQPVKPTPTGGGGIILDSGPTPAQMAQKREQEAQAAARKQQEEIAHAQAVQQAFDAREQAEAQVIKARAEAMRRDYDRRQAACRAGDRANCYAKVSEQ